MILFVLIGIPVTYLILASVSLLPSDVGLFMLVIANSAAWSLFHVRGSQRTRAEHAKSTLAKSMEPSRALVTTTQARRSK